MLQMHVLGACMCSKFENDLADALPCLRFPSTQSSMYLSWAVIKARQNSGKTVTQSIWRVIPQICWGRYQDLGYMELRTDAPCQSRCQIVWLPIPADKNVQIIAGATALTYFPRQGKRLSRYLTNSHPSSEGHPTSASVGPIFVADGDLYKAKLA